MLEQKVMQMKDIFINNFLEKAFGWDLSINVILMYVMNVFLQK